MTRCTIAAFICAPLLAAALSTAQCVAPDNGSGTANVPPPGCAYGTPVDNMQIIDGLPPATVINIDSMIQNILPSGMGGGVCSFPGPYAPGGSLGGDKSCSDATLRMPMTGTGALAGFVRLKNVPISMEVHTAPRTPGAPVQSFGADLFRCFGQITGDPDFDLLRIVAGTDFGLPSPGHTTLTQVSGGNWAVDSFFDITYRIDFVGNPGGPLAGRSGSTTGTVRIALPDPVGACCNTCTGACATVAASACTLLGGQFRGVGTTCATVTCRPEGACCLGLECRIVPRSSCDTRYLGDCTACVCPGGANVCCPADFNSSGAIGTQDIFDFLAAFFAGCP